MMESPRGRARGRARGRVIVSEESSAAQAPGVTSPQQAIIHQPAIAQAESSRGRGRASVQPRLQTIQQPPALARVKVEDSVSSTRCVQNKRGTTGHPINLLSNYFELSRTPDFTFYQYFVSFTPEVDRIGERKFMLKLHMPTLRGYVFDGATLFSTFKYQADPLILSAINTNGEQITISVTAVKEVHNTSNNFNQLLNILARRCLSLMGLTRLGRDFYDPQAKIMIEDFGLELWPGYTTSIRQHESQLLLSSAITCKVLRKETVLNIFERLHQQYGSGFVEPLKQAILGVVVMTDYNNRTYRVDDIDFEVNPLSQFSLRGGNMTTFVEYYKTKYQIVIRNTHQPLLVSRVKSNAPGDPESSVYLIPELCRMTGLTDEMRSNYKLMSSIAQFTRMEPQKRIDALLTFGRRLVEKPEIIAELKKFDMEFRPELKSIQGRIIPMETIVQGSAGREIRYESGQNVDWTQKLRANEMLAAGRMERWVVIIPSFMVREARQFVNQILQAARGMSLNITEPYVHDIRDDSIATYVNAIEQILSRQLPDILVCMVSNNRPDRYAAIKKKCCVERAVPTQVITKKSITAKSAMSIATKICIQMNCKVGGAPWTCVNPMKGVMVCGFDATHDSMNKRCSVGAFVSTLNNSFSRYFSKTFTHDKGMDISKYMAQAMKMAIDKFRAYNDGSLPSRIIFYRDGVGEGQIEYVLKDEVGIIKATLESIYGGPSYKLAFVIVSKRLNTKIFTNSRQNPPPGTVVDDAITLPERYDFYLVSQSVRQGTVSPTSYNVIFDNSGLDPDKMQRFTYKMTHLYYNWSGTIKVPAPVQYAHKLSELVGQHLHREPVPALEELLYFL
ncbi:piwi-like protein Siwi [Neocloeon triangulifer]|uniref:piwi-like protein Siwi n=1 Tax=Neocloeon triangulifer TaxID=2078957 RepID=UPI00286F8430|nr:piwi-like protein Siwi [Neocloeon triangulifer]XP_059490463.1 piwi-like protein Siwi [Neocloeon triangulifer]XP_059490464.1 piwi-like protein Siwi [Neocloeon triangulifer]